MKRKIAIILKIITKKLMELQIQSGSFKHKTKFFLHLLSHARNIKQCLFFASNQALMVNLIFVITLLVLSSFPEKILARNKLFLDNEKLLHHFNLQKFFQLMFYGFLCFWVVLNFCFHQTKKNNKILKEKHKAMRKPPIVLLFISPTLLALNYQQLT